MVITIDTDKELDLQLIELGCESDKAELIHSKILERRGKSIQTLYLKEKSDRILKVYNALKTIDESRW